MPGNVANNSLLDELKRFRIAAEQSIEMMIFTDPDGIVFWTNKATETVTGFTVQETVGKKVGVLWGKLMSEKWYANLWNTVKVKKKMFSSIIENHRKNGEHFWSTITIHPMLDKKKNIQFLISTQRDITHERNVDRMKTDFIALASHQLRTPITSIRWNIEMMKNKELGTLSKDQKKIINNVYQSTERMIDLINGLLDISRIESGKLIVESKSTDIIKLVSNVVKQFRETINEKKQNITITNDPVFPKVIIDPKLIRQVLINLLSNATKFTPVSGKINIVISNNNKEVEIQISDTGVGIPANEQYKLFERFYRGSNISKLDSSGTGLGLYLSKIIVESTGGKIWLKSTQDQGTSVWVTIPKSGRKHKSNH